MSCQIELDSKFFLTLLYGMRATTFGLVLVMASCSGATDDGDGGDANARAKTACVLSEIDCIESEGLVAYADNTSEQCAAAGNTVQPTCSGDYTRIGCCTDSQPTVSARTTTCWFSTSTGPQRELEITAHSDECDIGQGTWVPN
jgi:hypothetical protein